MKKILQSLSLVLLIFLINSCSNEPSPSGHYIDNVNQKIITLEKSSLVIYDLLDFSNKKEYSISNIRDGVISIENYEEELNYTFENEILSLFDYDLTFFHSQQLEFVKIKFNGSFRVEDLSNEYWKCITENKEAALIFKINNNEKDGDEYFGLKNEDNFDFKHIVSFNVSEFSFSEELNFFTIESMHLEGGVFFVEELKADSLILFDITSSKRLPFERYTSNENNLIYGNWNPDIIDIQSFSIPDTKHVSSLFANTIIIDEKNISFKVNDSSIKLCQESHKLKLGLDGKYLFIDNLDNNVIEVDYVSNDSLILKNPYMKGANLMKYYRVTDNNFEDK
ncbi:MAG: hypothetical protein HRT67_09115 [Flavobacteriaceae bacterium]|nr:hypothetical protein [Flavobacteriaceae bacterium]